MNCLERAMNAAKGKLTEQEVLDAFDLEQKIRQRLIDGGATGNLDERVAQRIVKLAFEKKVEAARAKRQVAQNIKARANLESMVNDYRAAGLSPLKALVATWEGTQKDVRGGRVSGYAQSQAYEASWIGSVFSEIESQRPHITKLFTDKSFDGDVTKELFELRQGGKPGVTGNSDAQFLARVLGAHMDISRGELNRLGAAIGKIDGYSGPQVHDDLAMIKAGPDKWVEDVLPKLDLERTFEGLTDVGEVKDTLKDIYTTIVTGVGNGVSPLTRGEMMRPGNIGRKFGSERVLHFKDAQAALEYRDAYGRGSTIQGIFGQLRQQARAAGAMDTYGPNPKIMLQSMAGKMQSELREKSKSATGKDLTKILKQIDELQASDGEVARLKSTIDAITGMNSRPVNVSLANIGNSIRTVESMTKLGGAVLTAMPTDTFTMAHAAAMRGQGYLTGLFNSIGELMSGKDGKALGYLLGEGFDDLTGHISSIANDSIPGRMSKIAGLFFKWNGLSGWTDAARSVSARVIAAHLGQNVEVSFAKLDASLQHVLKLNGITPAKWEVMRQAGSKALGDRSYLTPDLIRSLPDEKIMPLVSAQIEAIKNAMKKDSNGILTEASLKTANEKAARLITDARRSLELDLHRYIADETSYAVLEGDAASRRVSAMGTRPGTVAGEAVRFLMQFKGFPIAFSQRILGRAINNAPTGRLHQALNVGGLMAGLTMAGYMAIVMRESAKGIWPPRDPFSLRTFKDAFVRGGGTGLYGDIILGATGSYGKSALEALAGPTVGSVSDVYKIWADALNGKPRAGDAINAALNTTPFINVWYTRPALDMLFINSLKEWASPGYLIRRSDALRKNTGQHRVLPDTISQAVR